MLTCKEASALVSQGLDRRLSWRQRLNLRLHLLACDACTSFKRQMQFLQIAVRHSGAQAGGALLGLSQTARERIRVSLRNGGTQ